MSKRMKAGFTLIELLVVIAIIAILAAILFPVFARARENARRSSCQSNLKQIALGVMQYTQDYDEKFPAEDLVNTPPTFMYASQLQPYLKSIQIFVCPSNAGSVITSTPIDQADHQWNLNNIIGSYGFSVYLDGQSQASVLESARTGAFADSRWFSFGTLIDPTAIGFTGYTRHFNGANICFVDGHVKWANASTAQLVNFAP